MTENNRQYQKITIVGVGLIGGSLGIALRAVSVAANVVGYDIDRDSLVLAQQLGAVDSWTTNLAEAVKGAQIVFLSTPVGLFPSLVKDLVTLVEPGCIITDTGSTKSRIINELLPLIPEHLQFVPGHPMAGSERGGIEAADRYLFENAVYVLTPHERNTQAAVAEVKGLAEAVGSRVIEMNAREHDTIVAAVSHVPHLTAASLTSALMEVSHSFPFAPMLAAGGFRDTTRIAAGDPDLWEQICFSNQEKIVEILNLLISKLKTAGEFIAEGNREGLRKFLSEAREQRLKIPSGLRGILPALYEIVVTVPDRPGIIAFISTLLGNNNVNIIDIEILRVREGEGGTIRLGFQSESERDKGEKVLREHRVPLRRL